jgi:hypothetical protein
MNGSSSDTPRIELVRFRLGTAHCRRRYSNPAPLRVVNEDSRCQEPGRPASTLTSRRGIQQPKIRTERAGRRRELESAHRERDEQRKTGDAGCCGRGRGRILEHSRLAVRAGATSACVRHHRKWLTDDSRTELWSGELVHLAVRSGGLASCDCRVCCCLDRELFFAAEGACSGMSARSVRRGLRY